MVSGTQHLAPQLRYYATSQSNWGDPLLGDQLNRFATVMRHNSTKHPARRTKKCTVRTLAGLLLLRLKHEEKRSLSYR